MTETYKYNSRLITGLAFVAMLLAAITPEAWQNILPGEYWVFIPTIIAALTWLAAQLSEEKRVEVAEQLVIEKQNEILGQPLTNEEYIEEADQDGT